MIGIQAASYKLQAVSKYRLKAERLKVKANTLWVLVLVFNPFSSLQHLIFDIQYSIFVFAFINLINYINLLLPGQLVN